MVPVIRIDEEVYRWLQAQARPFEDNPNSVLKRIKALQSEKAELLKQVHNNVELELDATQEAELEDLKFSDPETWRSMMNAYEAQAQAKYAKEVDEKLTAVSAKRTETAKQNTGGHLDGVLGTSHGQRGKRMLQHKFGKPILQVLKSLGNTARRADVLENLEEPLKDELIQYDKSTNVDPVVRTMRKEGILKTVDEIGKKGIWSLTEYGQELAESD